jgi:hypothetical protein
MPLIVKVRNLFQACFLKNQIAWWLDCADHDVASLRRSSTGLIAAIMGWHYYGDHQVARLRRSWNGSIAPIINNFHQLRK